jgi:cholinesterase
VNTFRYRYYGEYPNLRLTLNGRFGPSGAWHGAEIPMIFGTQVDASTEANTAPETALSKYMQSVWAAFAKDPENALYEDPFGFPQYNSLS